MFDILDQKHRNTKAALELMRTLLSHHGACPETIVTDGLNYCAAAMKQRDLEAAQ